MHYPWMSNYYGISPTKISQSHFSLVLAVTLVLLSLLSPRSHMWWEEFYPAHPPNSTQYHTQQ